MAMTERSSNPNEIDLGLNDNSYPLTGFRQMGVDLDGFSLFIRTAFQTATDLGADDVGFYVVGGVIDPQFVLAGWLGDQVVKSHPSSQISDEMARELLQAIHDVQNKERQDAASG
ncbi:hypothetical protein E7T06_07220 [Deinococcus sp. Arct2-2]|uniref:hypothetical protein n=1 Tax=Deinococcus sp. Arct2-2 TaxID=2568653 RepID=UPI0010A4C37E|nr:hypothetical protein [Deinococcus sp. Arct2-2]THF70488.1 hypothetical protein E7T06_07220 [Deinococcus sp. Arct2-2]